LLIEMVGRRVIMSHVTVVPIMRSGRRTANGFVDRGS
jgi:hypothetical protein